ncbi:YggS family pyridoxal phosphate-dependent enzyme [candidate division WOR-3 bacterium]|nr:YggS family pyridoxal phosphate-dependent enzyme [candidate division WOR-3 bacterium]
MDVASRLERVRQRIAAACDRAGRDPRAVTLVAVTKTHPAEVVEQALRAGITDVGENRIQEAAAKKPQVSLPCRWHLVGHLQTNKAGRALEMFDTIQSLDSGRLADALQRRCAELNKTIDVLLEVNTSGEASKFGVEPGAAAGLCARVLELDRLRLTGLMTIGPGWAIDDPEASRPSFRRLRQLAAELRARFGIPLPRLSMGMTSDFEVGIEEGATDIRVGTALFGARS